MKKLFILFIIVACVNLKGQVLPNQWHINSVHHIISSGDMVLSGFYDESKVEEIKLYFPQPNYWQLMTQNYNSKTDIPATLVYKGEEYDSVGVRFKGQTSYFTNNTQKKSFNISIDYIHDNSRIEGYKTLNLNNAWQDPSMMREVLYYHLIRKHSHSSQANFVHLYLNDVDWGLYLNVQQLNKDFLDEWYQSNDGINMRADMTNGTGGMGGPPGGQWGDGTAALNYLGNDTTEYQKYYELKSSDIDSSWQKLIEVCDVLNNTPHDEFEEAIQSVLDVDKVLWHLACEIAFSDDDSYVYKGKMDYFIYFDVLTQRWASYDYDANSTFSLQHTNWSPFYNETKINYPLLNMLLAVNSFRQRYLAHLRTIINLSFDAESLADIIDDYDSLIRQIVFADTKKATSNNAYIAGLQELKNFVNIRKNNLLSDSEVAAIPPKISELTLSGISSWDEVHSDDEPILTCQISHPEGIKSVNLYVGESFSSRFRSYPMMDDGNGDDELANDGIFTTTLPSFPVGSLIKHYVEAVADNTQESRAFLPEGAEHSFYYYQIKTEIIDEKSVVINEFMADNAGIVLDEADESDDWIELYNLSDEEVDLSGYFLTDKTDNLTKFEIPSGITIPSKGYLIFWADEDQEQGDTHTNFKLSAGGESIVLSNPNFEILDSINFGEQMENVSYARKPNGIGDFQFSEPTFAENNDILGISDTDLAEFRVYPNPNSGSFKVLFDEIQEMPVVIFNEMGIQVKSILASSNTSLEIDLDIRGLYLLKYKNQLQKVLVTK